MRAKEEGGLETEVINGHKVLEVQSINRSDAYDSCSSNFRVELCRFMPSFAAQTAVTFEAEPH